MTLLQRIMWPRQGEEVAIYRQGELLIEGHVTHSGDDGVIVLGREAETRTFERQALLQGITNGTLVVKKKNRTASPSV
jgi:hypothetical protein